MVRFWTNHWRHSSWRNDLNEEYKPLRHASSNTFRRRGVSPGDMVYIVSIADGQLLLGGRMTVKRIVSTDQAAQILRNDNLYEASEHIIGKGSDGTPLNLHRRFAPAVARQLRFVSPNSNPKGLPFISDTHLDGQATRGIRELTPESAALLDQIIEVTDRLPRSGQLIIVTEELLRNKRAEDGAGTCDYARRYRSETHREGDMQQTLANRTNLSIGSWGRCGEGVMINSSCSSGMATGFLDGTTKISRFKQDGEIRFCRAIASR